MNIGCRVATWSKPTARDYEQDGLIAMWDGIENAGWGAHNASATTWTDLTGNHVLSYQWTPSFTDNAFVLPGTNKVAYCTSDLWMNAVNANNCTVEMCFKGYSCGGNNSIIALNYALESQAQRSWWVWGQVAFSYRASGHLWSASDLLALGENDPLTLSFPLANCYKNGILVKEFGSTGSIVSTSKVLTIGKIGPHASEINGYISMRADIYSIRIYANVLSSSQISANYAVDKARFGLP